MWDLSGSCFEPFNFELKCFERFSGYHQQFKQQTCCMLHINRYRTHVELELERLVELEVQPETAAQTKISI